GPESAGRHLLRPQPRPVRARLRRGPIPLRRGWPAHPRLGVAMRALICLSLLLPSVALAQDAAAPLARNAWYWQARARSDKAEDAWKNVLKVAPDNPEALAGLGGSAARGGRSAEGRGCPGRLVTANLEHPGGP